MVYNYIDHRFQKPCGDPKPFYIFYLQESEFLIVDTNFK